MGRVLSHRVSRGPILGTGRTIRSSGSPAATWAAFWAAIGATAAGLVMGWPTAARAAPGDATRLGGMEGQGPASRAITALHHNPAMLGALGGSEAMLSFSGGIDQLWVRRHETGSDPATGLPVTLDGLADRTYLSNPVIGYFAGASFYADPVAFGLGVYDLGSRYRFYSGAPLRYHLAPDPQLRPQAPVGQRAAGGCIALGLARCPPDGGHVEYRQDITAAIAWNTGPVQLGAGVHFPIVRTRFAVDNDVALSTDPITAECDGFEDPRCTERVGFKGWTQWIPRAAGKPGFDVALTLGIAATLPGDRITLGARYRTFALRSRGRVTQSGVGIVCRPDDFPETNDRVDSCDAIEAVDATLESQVPQEIALGGSFVLGPSKLWRVDTNLYWIDLCPGGVAPGRCETNGSQVLRLIGADRDSFVGQEFTRYRGRQDVYGVDVYTSYRARSTLAAIFAGHFSSPAVRPEAVTAADNQAWRIGLSGGISLRLRQSDFLLIPGYGLDVYLPVHIRPGIAAFDPAAGLEFERAGGDLNAPRADAVLAGRGRPSNAGRYFGLVHTLSLAMRWSGRARGVD